MKRIWTYYWQQNYPLDKQPTFVQRWWVQRWMELTDSKTSYWHSVPLTNTYSLLEEIMTWRPYPVRNLDIRTLFFLLSEFLEVIQSDKVLKDISPEDFYEKLIKRIEKVISYLEWYCNKIGNRGIRITDARERAIIGLYLAIYKPGDLTENSKFSDGMKDTLSTEISSGELISGLIKTPPFNPPIPPLTDIFLDPPILNQLNKVLTKTSYLSMHEDLIVQTMRANPSDKPSESTIEDLNNLTKSLIVELVRNKYTIAHLNEKCRDWFLRPSDETFFDRMSSFFKELVVNPPSFDVYMRIQGKKSLRDVGRIGKVEFMLQAGEIKDFISSSRLSVEKAQEEHAKHFFRMDRSNKRQVFVRVSSVVAENYGKAAILALHKVDQAMRQIQFGVEIGGFNIDNRIYVHDTRAKKLFYFTKRQALSRYGITGNSKRLNELLSRLDRAKKNTRYEYTEGFRKVLIKKALSTALHWHRSGIESMALETKFTSHWIGLEQIFTIVKDEVRGKKTSGDKLVLAISETMVERTEKQALLDLRGDFVRCGFFGPPRLLASYTGHSNFNYILLRIMGSPRAPILISDKDYIDHLAYGMKRPKISIRENGKTKQTINIQPGTVLYIDHESPVREGQWIGGAKLSESNNNSAMQKLFYDQIPSLKNIWYLVCASRYQQEALADFAQEFDTEDLLAKSPLNMLEILNNFHDLLSIIQYLASNGFTRSEITVYNIVHNNLREGLESKINMKLNNNPSIQVLWKRLNSTLMINYFHLYEAIQINTYYYLKAHRNKEEKKLLLPTSIIQELYRGQQPPDDIWEDVVLKHSAELTLLCNGQPLLEQRVQAYSKKRFDSPPLEYYLWQVDRIKRVRNELVHEGKSEHPILELLTLRLYQYSRIFLTKIIHRMADSESQAVNKILSLSK